MLRRLSRINTEKLQRRLNAATATRGLPADAWRRALAARLVHRSRRLDQAISRAGSMYAPVRLHAVRSRRRSRYALELAGESGILEARPHVTTVKRAQTALGRLQDLQVVLRQVDRASAEAASTCRRVRDSRFWRGALEGCALRARATCESRRA